MEKTPDLSSLPPSRAHACNHRSALALYTPVFRSLECRAESYRRWAKAPRDQSLPPEIVNTED